MERLLGRQKVSFEVRATGQEELGYEVELPARKKTDQLADAILALDPDAEMTVEWESTKKGK